MRNLLGIFLVLVFTTLTIVSGYADTLPPMPAPNQSVNRTVRVGWFESDGVHSLDENGNPSGYDYDYLQAISQHTNWEYEYIEGTWAECLEWLKNGDIDLLNIVNKTPQREEYLDYSYSAAGTELCCLFVDTENTQFAYEDFKNFDGMVIGIEEGTFQRDILKEYAISNNFTYTTIEYPTLTDCQKAVTNGEVDALLSSNTDVIYGYKTIAQFNPVPFYFATTKGNTELLNELNYGINQLFVYYPNFSNYLYSKYYGNNTSSDVVFTSEEQTYIQSKPTVKILMDPIWYPIESYNPDSKSFEGIVPSLLSLVSQKSGLEFIYENGVNSVDVLKEFSHSTDNIITSITYDYHWAYENNVNITQPFIDASIMLVTKDKTVKPKTVALVEVDYISEQVKKLLPELTPIYFDSMAKCIEAVYKGAADCAYMNNCEAEYYMSMAKYRKLNFHTTDLFRQKLCFGVSQNADPQLFSIISKCLQSIPDNEVQNLIYENSFTAAPITLKTFAQYNPTIVIGTFLSFLLVILIGAIMVFRSELKNSKKLAVENQRYNQLAEMTNEHIYEYSYEKDTLTFNNAPDYFFAENSCFSGGDSVIKNYSKVVQQYVAKGDDFENTLYSCFAQKKDMTKEINMFFAQDHNRWYKVSSKIITDSENHAIYAIGKIRDVQKEHEERELLIERAERDGLTGLYNAKAFSNICQSLLSSSSVLMLMDIDHFKNINDKYGHYNGDKALIAVANILAEIFKDLGCAGRLGGDEFAVFIPDGSDCMNLEHLCTSLLQKASDITITEGIKPITLSIGVVTAHPKETYLQLYKRSDGLLYEVKNHGRNGFKIG